jgi:hypothetical protein
MESKKAEKIVILPTPTIHNIRTAVAREVGNNYILETLLETDLVDFEKNDWRYKMKDKLISLINKYSDKTIYFVMVGHPLVNAVMVKYAQDLMKRAVWLLGWDSMRRKYKLVILPYEVI